MSSDLGLYLVFFAIGVAAQGVALLLARRPIRLLRAGACARGTVLGIEEERSSTGRSGAKMFYFPIVGFTTGQGEQIQFRSRVGRGRVLPKGSKVPVIYDPAKPDDAELRTFMTMWFASVVTAVCGWPFLAAGLSGLLK